MENFFNNSAHSTAQVMACRYGYFNVWIVPKGSGSVVRDVQDFIKILVIVSNLVNYINIRISLWLDTLFCWFHTWTRV